MSTPIENTWRAHLAPREQRLLEESLAARNFHPTPLERWCPHRPWPKQWRFLSLDALEAFYGGAAAGGKSEALLMAALAYVDVPGYAALILRRDTRRLRLAGGLIPRAASWLAARGPQFQGPEWNGDNRTWTFSTSGAPATLSFGYLVDPTDKYRYGSSEYQYIAFDELTEFPEDDYLFLFSRLRRSRQVFAPLRMRAASNPGGPGHDWVKRRFLGEEHARQIAAGVAAEVLWHEGRACVPARIRDNPGVNEPEYRASLSRLSPIVRERLMNGDWTVREEGLVRPEWLRDFAEVDAGLELRGADERALTTIVETECLRFVTIDPAGSSADRAKERSGRPRSWTALQVWDRPRTAPWSKRLLLRECLRERVGFDGLCRMLLEVFARWKPDRMWIENEKLGQAAVDVLGARLPLRTIATQGRDKVARAGMLISKLERGEVHLPIDAPWRANLEAEWLGWTGHPHETSDQIDAAAYAALVAQDDEDDERPIIWIPWATVF